MITDPNSTLLYNYTELATTSLDFFTDLITGQLYTFVIIVFPIGILLWLIYTFLRLINDNER